MDPSRKVEDIKRPADKSGDFIVTTIKRRACKSGAMVRETVASTYGPVPILTVPPHHEDDAVWYYPLKSRRIVAAVLIESGTNREHSLNRPGFRKLKVRK